MFIKFILANKDITYQELQEKFNNLEVGYNCEEYIELYDVKPDGTLVFKIYRKFIGD